MKTYIRIKKKTRQYLLGQYSWLWSKDTHTIVTWRVNIFRTKQAGFGQTGLINDPKIPEDRKKCKMLIFMSYYKLSLRMSFFFYLYFKLFQNAASKGIISFFHGRKGPFLQNSLIFDSLLRKHKRAWCLSLAGNWFCFTLWAA